MLQDVGLPGVEGKRCEDLSKGMLQRVQFLAAIIHQPDLLILDEPFSGQDPVSVRILREQIQREHRRGATVLLSTHVMAHAEEMCQHVVMIHQGRKVLDEAMSGLRRQFDPRTVYFEPLDAVANVSGFSGVSGVERVESIDGTYRITLLPGTDPAGVMARLTATVAPARIELARLRLEDVFVRIVAEDAHSDAVSRALRASVTAPSEGALA
jgi:ABC-2 type transport system ATP-binding protein